MWLSGKKLRLTVHSVLNEVAVALASRQRRKSRHDFQSLIPFLINIVEQDHRSVKSRLGPMLGAKRFFNARRVVAWLVWSWSRRAFAKTTNLRLELSGRSTRGHGPN